MWKTSIRLQHRCTTLSHSTPSLTVHLRVTSSETEVALGPVLDRLIPIELCIGRIHSYWGPEDPVEKNPLQHAVVVSIVLMTASAKKLTTPCNRLFYCSTVCKKPATALRMVSEDDSPKTSHVVGEMLLSEWRIRAGNAETDHKRTRATR